MNTIINKQKYSEVERIKRKEKKAWALYYESARQYFDLLEHIKKKTNIDKLISPPSCFVESVTELYDEANKKLECNICLEIMTKQTFAFTNCFHIMCINCIKRLSKDRKHCPTCRRNM
uniref:RING-type domain-containing protein n=1 Tax=viral metagenome TaxID=1070528 RepID=A0A6C0J8E5_9ZZZZ